MKKIKIISILLMLSVYSYAINIEIRFGQSTSNILEEKVKNDIKELLEKQLGFFQETYIVDINDKDIESFENSLRKRNKRFLQEYSKENKIDIMITLNYKKSSKSIQSRVFLNDEQNSEKNNYTLITKIILDDKKTQKKFKPKVEEDEYEIKTYVVSEKKPVIKDEKTKKKIQALKTKIEILNKPLSILEKQKEKSIANGKDGKNFNKAIEHHKKLIAKTKKELSALDKGFKIVKRTVTEKIKKPKKSKPKSKKEIFVNKNDTYNDRKIYAISICSSIMQNLNELNVLKYSKGKI